MPADPVVSPADTLRRDDILRHYTPVCRCEWSDDEFTRTMTSDNCVIHGKVPDPLDALLAVGERDKAEIEALRGCPAGNGCAINAGAIHCYHCRRNYPPDDTWEQAFLDRPDLRQGEIRTLHSILDEKLSAGERDRRQIAQLTDALTTLLSFARPVDIEACLVQAGVDVRAVLADKEDAANG